MFKTSFWVVLLIIFSFVLSLAPTAEAGCLGLFGGNGIFGRMRANRQARRGGYSVVSYSYGGGACSNGSCGVVTQPIPQILPPQPQQVPVKDVAPVAPNHPPVAPIH